MKRFRTRLTASAPLLTIVDEGAVGGGAEKLTVAAG